jgi:zinc transporter ZupT
MSLLEHLSLIGSILLIGIIAIGFIGVVKNLSRIWLAFSGAFLVSITFLHLFPIIFHNGPHAIGLWVLIGFFGQLVLDQFSSGIEHGHLHTHDKRSSKMLILQVMLGLGIHSFVEGISLAGFEESWHLSHEHTATFNNINPLLIGIILHHAPAAFALIMVLASSKISKPIMLTCLTIFAIMPSLGALTTSGVHLEMDVLQKILGFVAGSFLHVATTILFETDNSDHRLPYKNLLASIAGVLLALLTL